LRNARNTFAGNGDDSGWNESDEVNKMALQKRVNTWASAGAAGKSTAL
jgi:hypothetical protein